MNDDDEVFGAVRASLKATQHSLNDVTLDQPVERITRRARSRRLKQGVVGAGTAGVALAVVLGASGTPGSSHADTPQATAHEVHIDMAAWSVDSEPGGIVRVTLRELRDEQQLIDALKQAGVPAVIHTGEQCFSVAEATPAMEEKAIPPKHVNGTNDDLLDIVPSAIPKGSEIVLNYEFTPLYRYDKQGHLLGEVKGKAFELGFSAELARANAPLTCKPNQPGPMKQLPGTPQK